MTVQQLIDRLNRNRVELDQLTIELCSDPKIRDFDFESVFSQVTTARRVIEFSLRLLHKLHPDTHFSSNEAIKKPKAELIMLCGERGAYASDSEAAHQSEHAKRVRCTDGKKNKN